MANPRHYRVILPALIACVAFGWAFFHLYLAASITRNAADQAQADWQLCLLGSKTICTATIHCRLSRWPATIGGRMHLLVVTKQP